MKKEDTNDIVQYLMPALGELDIPVENCKVDVTTEKSGNKRGDVWVSLNNQSDKNFEQNIVGLIEAKHKNTIIGDIDWRDAMRQGKGKSAKQGLKEGAIVEVKKHSVRWFQHVPRLDGKSVVYHPPDVEVDLI